MCNYESRYIPDQSILARIQGISVWPFILTLMCWTMVACQDANETDINTVLMQTSEVLNRQLPEMVDDEKILEATSGFNNQFSYYFTLVDYSIDEIDIDAFRNQVRPRHIDDVCTSTSLQPFLEEGVTISYIYADKDRNEFTTISVGPMDCEINR